MRDNLFAVRLTAMTAGACLLVVAAGSLVRADGDTAAHGIAEKFAREAAKGDVQARRRAQDERRKANEAEEADMLAHARAEAERRRFEMMRAREDAERADRQRKADEGVKQAEAARKAEEEARAVEALRLAETRQKAEEERRLAEVEARRKAEEEARVAEDVRQAESARRAEEERRRADAQRVAEEARLADIASALEAARAEEARRIAEEEQQRAVLESEREMEARHLAERLRSVREEREARAAEAASDTHQWSSADPSEPVHPVSQREGRVTVLLLMQPGDRGIRRRNKTADPVLCSYRDCYVSSGPDRAASLLPARKALGFFRTWGRRAGACNNSLGCVFRGVDLDSLNGMLMPVDMRVVRHDRRLSQNVEAASECRLERDRLTCRNGIHAGDYTMWLVPEGLAERAGPAVLMRALEDDMALSERTASAPLRSAR